MRESVPSLLPAHHVDPQRGTVLGSSAIIVVLASGWKPEWWLMPFKTTRQQRFIERYPKTVDHILAADVCDSRIDTVHWHNVLPNAQYRKDSSLLSTYLSTQFVFNRLCFHHAGCRTTAW